MIGASVWITRSIWKPSGAWMWRPVPDTIPAVAVCGSPNGEPIATASWPVRTPSESASSSACSDPVSPVSTSSTARSEERSTPATRACAVSSSANCTCTVSLSPTTCALVTSVPSASTTKPVPEPLPVRTDTTPSRAAS